MSEELKWCPHCQKFLPKSEFGKDKSRPDGLKVYCKQRDKEYREANKEKISKQVQAWREANPERNRQLKKKWEAEHKEHLNERSQRWRAENPERRKEIQAAYRERHKDKVNNSAAQYREENREEIRERQREWVQNNITANLGMKISQYGITVDQYFELLVLQDYVCAICGQECAIRERLGVDHDHKTNTVRGLLCHHCNHALGQFKDSIDNLVAAIEYLENPPWSHLL